MADDTIFPKAWTDGLTKREYFAGLAMQGFLSSTYLDEDLKHIAKLSVECADALIEALKEKK